MGRAPCCDKANVKRGPWSPEEDGILRNYIERNGTAGNWIALPQKAGLKRCGKSCRLRWLNYLRPDIRHGNFSEEEDNIICSLFKSIGSRWSVIASHLHGRTDNDVKNYWNTKLKKRMIALESSLVQISQPETVLNTVIKPEEFINWSFENYGTSMEFYTEPPPLMPVSMNLYKQEAANYYATSSTTPESNSAASSSIENWSATDPFLSDLGFDSYTEFLNGYRQVV